MLEEIRQKSLDELEELMAGQRVESAANGAAADDKPEDDDVVDHQAQGGEAGRGADAPAPRAAAIAAVAAGRSVFAAFARSSNASQSGDSLAAGSNSGGSVFVPSNPYA